MKTKLTLSIDRLIVEKGKKVARKEKKSLSALVEELLKEEIDRDTKEKRKLIDELHGVFGEVKEDTDWKKVIRDSASKKHGK